MNTMNTSVKSEALFKALVKIKDEINEQIPFVPNHFEEFDRVPWDPSWSDEQKTAFIEEVDRKFFVHEKHFASVSAQFKIYKHLNELFAQYLRENDFSSPANMTLKQQ